jgi:hypothetical protein
MGSGIGASLRRIFGGVLILAGIAVFAVRLHHEGPYAFPGGGNLRAGVLALLLGAWLVRDWIRGPLATRLHAVASVVGAVVLFFALYAVLAETEEVVTLRVADAAGSAADLRLWIVDRDGAAWVTMPGRKADAHGLREARAELLRDGAFSCVVATRDETRATVEATYDLRQEKYAVQRLATTIGLMERRGSADTVALRLDPCPVAG